MLLALGVTGYYLVSKKHQTTFLNVFSLALIGYWNAPSVIVVLFLTIFTYLITKSSSKPFRTTGVILHVIILLSLKTELLWIGNLQTIDKWTFLGLSYFSLQNISVLLSSNKEVNFNHLLLGNSFASRFVAGPILTKKDFLSLPTQVQFNNENISAGFQRIIFGLGKKIILADRLAIITHNIFEAQNHQANGFSIVFASLIFTLQMYLDFSAYSDIAIGSAKLFGIDFKENFNLPLRSKTVTEYWRKTHMSLIAWLTEHVYYPLVYALRKKNKTAVYLGISITFIISGIWHGNHVGYLIWGMLNALYLNIEYWGKKKEIGTKKTILNILLTFVIVSFSNFFFALKSWDNIASHFTMLYQNNFFPKDWMVDFVAIIGNGGHFLQQYNLLETAVLILLFFGFEKKLELLSKSNKPSFLYVTVSILLIIFFGYFNAGDEFIYVQF